MPDAGLLSAVVLVLLALHIVFSGARIVSEHERLVVFRLGKNVGQRGPGAVFLLPLVDRAVREVRLQ